MQYVCLYLVCSGVKSKLFLDLFMPKTGQESLFLYSCQVQFLLARVEFVKHALVKLKSNVPILEVDAGKLFAGK